MQRVTRTKESQRRNGGEKSNKLRQGKMPRKGNRQSRRKPHREEKRSIEANDEAHPRNKRQVKASDPGAQRKEQKPKAKVILRSRSRGKGKHT